MSDIDQRIRALCEKAIAEHTFPGCQVAYVADGTTRTQTFGRQTYESGSPAVTAETRYDVASITKSVPTASLLMKLIEDGRLGLDDQVIKYVPEMSNDFRENVLMRHLLTYTVIFDFPDGLAAAAKRNPNTIVDELLAAPLAAPPGERYFYTNGPAIVMGLVVERVYGRSLAEIARTELFQPLDMNHSGFASADFESAMAAPTEHDWRGEVQGQPHDEAAWAMAQSRLDCGAAGLFSTASDLLRFAQMLLDNGKTGSAAIFQPKTVEQMHTNQLQTLGLTAGLGWEMGRPEIMGQAVGPQVFMKSGFTGCLMVIDPQRSTAMVHLSNRTYPKRPERGPIQAFWRELNAMVFLGR